MSTERLQQICARLRASPQLLIPAALALARGYWYKFKFALLLKSFSAGPWFRVYGPLTITGPGKVVFGANFLVISNAIKPVCIRTLTPEAEIIFDDECGLNGTSLQCAARIQVGRGTTIADAYITDTAAHVVEKNRRQIGLTEVPSDPVSIGNNVWISVKSVILEGVTIGDNAVVGACSLVQRDIPANRLAIGNPAKLIRKLNE